MDGRGSDGPIWNQREDGDKWIDRYEGGGLGASVDRSRRPQSCPHETAADLIEAILALRRRHPTWGPQKLRHVLRTREPQRVWPARSTIADFVQRHGLVTPSRRRPTPAHPGRPDTAMAAPNHTWTADFKGHFKTRNGLYCYLLTLVDGCSRYLLECQRLRSTGISLAKRCFCACFRLTACRTASALTNNGVPFGTTALGRLSTLAVWWIRLGIRPELIEPASSQQNGRHERVHRTLKAETTRPPAANLQAQQVRFNRFRQEYNETRPHEALAQQTPASLYRPSRRALPSRLPPVDYPRHFETRRVSRNSGLRGKTHWVCVTHTLAGEYVGLEEVDDALWDVYFGPVKLGRMDGRRLQIEDHKGQWARKHVSPMSPD